MKKNDKMPFFCKKKYFRIGCFAIAFTVVHLLVFKRLEKGFSANAYHSTTCKRRKNNGYCLVMRKVPFHTVMCDG